MTTCRSYPFLTEREAFATSRGRMHSRWQFALNPMVSSSDMTYEMWLAYLSYPILQAKPSTHRVCAQDHLFHIHRHKVFTNSQMS
jgi:hypothetical protein